jgi:tRNA nucleotidyltransferase (CCA-adding enzyme)
MDVPAPDELLGAVARLPAARPLIERLGEEPPVALVGGAVRDVLMGVRPDDVDFVVEGDAATMAARLGGTVKVHDRFGTSTVTLDGFTYDLARARRETYSRPGALPDVTPAPLEQDLHRRDFTVNAMAIRLNGRRRGELLTAPRALGDLEARLLRVLHDRSFVDDPTRLFRLCRYRSRLGFEIEGGTAARARLAIHEHALRTVSGSRIGAELRLLAREPDPVAALRSLHELGLDAEIDPDFGIEAPQLGTRALELLAAAPEARRDRLAVAVAAMRVPRPRLAALLNALAFEAGDRDAIVAAATRAPELARSLSEAIAPSEIAAAVGGASLELVALAGALGPADQARAWLERLRHVALEIDGGDLLSAGIPEGPAIGAALRGALMAKLDGRASGREQELEEALRASTGG